MGARQRQASGLRSLGCGLVLVAATTVAGCASGNGFETRSVARDDLGAAWPFVADRGVLACEPGDVPTFTADGTTVGLDEPDLERRPWADDVTEEQVDQVRAEALALC